MSTSEIHTILFLVRKSKRDVESPCLEKLKLKFLHISPAILTESDSTSDKFVPEGIEGVGAVRRGTEKCFHKEVGEARCPRGPARSGWTK